jgi:lipopolysaccharide/colanic/teichoic acid biosynthesis glycosyltransferase
MSGNLSGSLSGNVGKRLFDLLAAGAGVVLLAPLLLGVALWVKLDSAGPVLFRQVRVGRHGVPFEIYKFRTMADRPAGGPRDAGPQLTIGRDPRVTRAGRFLRRYKLDELPQLFNVLEGTMSLVGPRPEVPRYVECYPPAVRNTVLSVAPGVTDLAAILYKDESTILGHARDPERAYVETILPVKLEYYQRYVRERSFWLDLRIIFRTLAAIVR